MRATARQITLGHDGRRARGARGLPPRLPRYVRHARPRRRRRTGREGSGRPRPAGHRRLSVRQGLRLPGAGLLRGSAAASAGAHWAQGVGVVRARVLGRGPGSGGGRAARRNRHPRGRVDPALQLHGHDGARPGGHDERPGDERARRQRARADDLRHRRASGRHGRPWRLAGGRSRAVAPRPLPAPVGLEPDVHRAAPLAAAPGGPARRREAGGGRSRALSHRPRGRRSPAPAARQRRRAGHGHDAGGARRGPGRRGLVPRVRRRLRRAGGPRRRADGGGVGFAVPGPGRGRGSDRAGVRLGLAGAAPPRGRAPSAIWARRPPTPRLPACPP